MKLFKGYNLKTILTNTEKRLNIYFDERCLEENRNFSTRFAISGKIITSNFERNLRNLVYMADFLEGVIGHRFIGPGFEKTHVLAEHFFFNLIHKKISLNKRASFIFLDEKKAIEERKFEDIKEITEKYGIKIDSEWGFSVYLIRNNEDFATVYIGDLDKDTFLEHKDEFTKEIIEFLYKTYKEIILEKEEYFRNIVEGKEPVLSVSISDKTEAEEKLGLDFYLKNGEMYFHKELKEEDTIPLRVNCHILDKKLKEKENEIKEIIKKINEKLKECVFIDYGDNLANIKTVKFHHDKSINASEILVQMFNLIKTVAND